MPTEHQIKEIQCLAIAASVMPELRKIFNSRSPFDEEVCKAAVLIEAILLDRIKFLADDEKDTSSFSRN